MAKLDYVRSTIPGLSEAQPTLPGRMGHLVLLLASGGGSISRISAAMSFLLTRKPVSCSAAVIRAPVPQRSLVGPDVMHHLRNQPARSRTTRSHPDRTSASLLIGELLSP
jgi:hypothetical protein